MASFFRKSASVKSPQDTWRDKPLVYQPLDTARDEIRLVRLSPGRVRKVQFNILKISINNAPPFRALSYAWGPGSNSVLVTRRFRFCRISDTLRRFFEQADATTEDSQAWYWVDAICIDQSNIVERNEQVLRMKEIYEAAQRVVVWLDTHDIFQFESTLASEGSRQFFHPWIPAVLLERATLVKICECTWWKRAWIIQEASTPAIRSTSQPTVMWIGKYRCDFDACLQTLRGLELLGSFRSFTALEHNCVPSTVNDLAWIRAQRAKEWSRLEIYDLLPRIRRCEASDMRDKVYSILAISCDYDSKDLKPDYGKPTGEIYTSLVRYLIERDQKLDILAYCTAGRNIESLPSWVPGKAPWTGH